MRGRRQRGFRRSISALGIALLCVLCGCHKRPKITPLPPILAPIALVDVPRPAKEPMIEPVQMRLPPVPIATGPARPKQRRRPKPAPAIVTVPSQETTPVAAQPPAPQEAIGALSAGGDVNPHAQQEVTDLIGSIDRRLGGLSPQMAEAQKAQVSRIRNFEKQAQEALASGDLEGAKTLATKAKLLLDDMQK